MHTFRKVGNEFEVDYLQICNSDKYQKFIPLLKGMGIVSAIKMVSSLNGGEINFDSLYEKILPSLVA